MRILLVLIVLCIGANSGFADTAAEGFDMTAFLASSLSSFGAKWPWLATFFLVLGGSRSVLKPLFSIAHFIADKTSTLKDDMFLEKVEKSKFLKYFLWLADYIASAKLISPSKKANYDNKKLT